MTDPVYISCPHCDSLFYSIIDRKKHDLGHHYDYVLAQCHGDKYTLRQWVQDSANPMKTNI